MSLLFAVRDWIVAKRKLPPPEKKVPSIEESLAEIKRIQEDNEAFDKWAAREFVFDNDLGKRVLEAYESNSPERATIEFLNYWVRSNFGKMSEMILRYETLGMTVKKIAGELRDSFSSLHIKDFTLKSLTNKAPAVTEVTAELCFSVGGKPLSKEITFRWIYKNDRGENIGRWDRSGKWFLIDNFRWTVFR